MEYRAIAPPLAMDAKEPELAQYGAGRRVAACFGMAAPGRTRPTGVAGPPVRPSRPTSVRMPKITSLARFQVPLGGQESSCRSSSTTPAGWRCCGCASGSGAVHDLRHRPRSPRGAGARRWALGDGAADRRRSRRAGAAAADGAAAGGNWARAWTRRRADGRRGVRGRRERRCRPNTRSALGARRCRRLPWLEDEAGAGIHPLRTAPTGYGVALLAQARQARAARAARHASATTLALADSDARRRGSALAVGAGGGAAAAAVGDAPCAAGGATAAGDEAAFQDEVAARCERGASHCAVHHGPPADGWRRERGRSPASALALHGLTPADSLRVQCRGTWAATGGWGAGFSCRTSRSRLSPDARGAAGRNSGRTAGHEEGRDGLPGAGSRARVATTEAICSRPTSRDEVSRPSPRRKASR